MLFILVRGKQGASQKSATMIYMVTVFIVYAMWAPTVEKYSARDGLELSQDFLFLESWWTSASVANS